jgi:hypothetical protein
MSKIYSLADYKADHALCPKCGSEDIEHKSIGRIDTGADWSDYHSKLPVKCTKCRFKGIEHELTPINQRQTHVEVKVRLQARSGLMSHGIIYMADEPKPAEKRPEPLNLEWLSTENSRSFKLFQCYEKPGSMKTPICLDCGASDFDVACGSHFTCIRCKHCGREANIQDG